MFGYFCFIEVRWIFVNCKVVVWLFCVWISKLINIKIILYILVVIEGIYYFFYFIYIGNGFFLYL